MCSRRFNDKSRTVCVLRTVYNLCKKLHKLAGGMLFFESINENVLIRYFRFDNTDKDTYATSKHVSVHNATDVQSGCSVHTL